MIDWYFIQCLFVTACWIWGFQYTFKPGEIFGAAGDWMRDHWNENINKPIFDCRFCMASVHGTAGFCLLLWGNPWYMWVIFCFCLCGLSVILAGE